MIEKNEILEFSQSLDLSPDTVEKDYVLGWMLFGINANRSLNGKWIFKGGTSLKKCFFETFRFSEDLDFTISDKDHFSKDFLFREFEKIADAIYEKTGIKFGKENFKFKIIEKENGKKSAEGKIHFNGPLRRKNSYASIKLDLTNNEIVVLNPVTKKVHHPYSDEPKEGIQSVCYAFEEVVAEKVRALAERARPRDLYDVIHFFRNRDMILKPQLVYDVLEKKCGFKGIATPTFQLIEQHEKLYELEPQWGNMLAHQLPSLPPMDSFWRDLEPFFHWLYGKIQERHLDSMPKKSDETMFNPGRMRGFRTINEILHKIQFAAGNRVCLKIQYSGKWRTIEPLSFRKSSKSNRLFYGFHREAGHVKCFIIDKVQSIKVTNLPYEERAYPVEITASGKVSMPPQRIESRSYHRKSYDFNESPYTYECPYCGRKFKRKKMNSRLNPHKDKYGGPCPGSMGYLV